MALTKIRSSSSWRTRFWLIPTVCLIASIASGCNEDEKEEATEAVKEGVREFVAEEQEQNRPLKDKAWEGIGEGESTPVENVFGTEKKK